jgi:DNA mismatch endonuclease (patch repair protein)
VDYWLPKIEDNKRRDLKKIKELRKMQWRVAVIWQCSLDDNKKIESTIQRLADWIIHRNSKSKIVEF